MASQFHLKFILQKPLITVYCTVPENIHTPPTQGIGIYWGVGGGCSVRPKNLKTCMKLILNFQRGGGDLRNNLFRRGSMDIFWNYTLFAFNDYYLLYLLRVLIGLWDSLSPL